MRPNFENDPGSDPAMRSHRVFKQKENYDSDKYVSCTLMHSKADLQALCMVASSAETCCACLSMWVPS